MSNLEGIQIQREGLAHALADNTLAVPPNQRSYDWGKEEVQELFQDMAASMRNQGSDREYFLGSIVATSKGSRQMEIVDGQQRLATISILLAAIRNYFVGSRDEKRASSIESTYLLSTDLRSQELKPKLRLNESDNEYFLKAVLMPPGSPEGKIKPARESHRKIQIAAQVATTHVRNIVEQYSLENRADRLLDWVDFVTNKVLVVWVTVPDYADAYVIFETLNDRGKDLSTSDLLKNYLLGRSGDRLTDVRHKWSVMTGALETVASNDITVAYIRQLWSSIHGVTRERELFAEIKRAIKSKVDAIELAGQLADNANFYASLLNAEHEFWHPYGTSARKHVRTLRLLKMEQVRTLLLAALKHFSVSEAKKTLRLLVHWSVRFLVAGGSPGKVEDHYAKAAIKIRAKEISSAAELARAMATVVPDDTTFEHAFARATVSQSYLARYYLRALEQKAQDDPEPEMLVNDEEEMVNLEHILPRNLSSAWDGIDPDKAEGLSRRIGNMVLMRAKGNVEMDRKEFKDKIPYLKKSTYLLTKQVAETYKRWDENAIDDRQKKLAKLAVKTWPREP